MIQTILNQTGTKIYKGKNLYALGYSRKEVAQMLCNGNTGHAHNIWKKWLQEITESLADWNFEFNRNFGVEIEAYNAHKDDLEEELIDEKVDFKFEKYNHKTRSYWKVITDSSIVGNNAFEMVSPILNGEKGLKALGAVTRALQGSLAKTNKTCGLHVHFDVKDYSLENFKTLIKNFCLLEEQFDEMMPEHRRKNNNQYCFSLCYELKIQELFGRINQCGSYQEVIDCIQSRYVKLNVESYLKYGTVEFRQHEGTIRYIEIENWLAICARLVEFSKKNVLINDLNLILTDKLKEHAIFKKLQNK